MIKDILIFLTMMAIMTGVLSIVIFFDLPLPH